MLMWCQHGKNMLSPCKIVCCQLRPTEQFRTHSRRSDWHIAVGGGHAEILTSRVAAVGRYHQEFCKRVFDDVAPVDSVSMAQKFILVNQNATIQNLCRGRKDKNSEGERDCITGRIYGTYTPWQEINTPRLTPTLCLEALHRGRCTPRYIWAWR